MLAEKRKQLFNEDQFEKRAEPLTIRANIQGDEWGNYDDPMARQVSSSPTMLLHQATSHSGILRHMISDKTPDATP